MDSSCPRNSARVFSRLEFMSELMEVLTISMYCCPAQREGVSRAAYAVDRIRHADQGRADILEAFRIYFLPLASLALVVSCSR
jgi:hypothetical protein